MAQEGQEVEVRQRFHSAAHLVLHHLHPGNDEALQVVASCALQPMDVKPQRTQEGTPGGARL